MQPYPDISFDNYRQHYLSADHQQIRQAFSLFVIVIPLLSALDWYWCDNTWGLYLLLGLRVFELVAIILVLRHYSRCLTQDRWEQASLILLSLLFCTQVYSLILSQAHAAHVLLDAWLILLCFICFPLPLNRLRILALIYVVTVLLSVRFFNLAHWRENLAIYLSMPAFAMTADAIARYVHRYRQRLLSAEFELQRRAKTDPITGLPHWREFLPQAEIEIRRQQRLQRPLALLVVEIDKLNELIAQAGPAIGDIILAEVARRIQRNKRGYDLLARYSGEEFALVLPEINRSDAMALAWRCQHTLAALPVNAAGKEYALTLKVGWAELQPEDDLLSLLQRARLSPPIEPLPTQAAS